MNANLDFEDLALLDALLNLALSSEDPAMRRFATSLRGCGDEWIAVEPAYHPACELLEQFQALPGCHPLLKLFAGQRHRLRWEQSYRRGAGQVSDAMLDAYSFVEIVGKLGPFVSERVRAGIGLWGPNIDYPRHRHQAEEIYLLLAGSAEFAIGDSPPAKKSVGDAVHVTSNAPHGFVSGARGLAVFYLWQHGDLRQVSSFC